MQRRIYSRQFYNVRSDLKWGKSLHTTYINTYIHAYIYTYIQTQCSTIQVPIPVGSMHILQNSFEGLRERDGLVERVPSLPGQHVTLRVEGVADVRHPGHQSLPNREESQESLHPSLTTCSTVPGNSQQVASYPYVHVHAYADYLR